jgi:hypothetical protein
VGRLSGGVENTPLRPFLVGVRRLRSRLGTVDAVYGITEVSDDIALASQDPMAALTPVEMAASALIRQASPFGLLGLNLRAMLGCNRGEVGQLAGAAAKGALPAVLLIELDGEVTGPVALPLGRWGMLAPHFEKAHWKPERVPDEAIPVRQLNAGVPAVTARQLDHIQVVLAHGDRLGIILVHLHVSSTPGGVSPSTTNLPEVSRGVSAADPIRSPGCLRSFISLSVRREDVARRCRFSASSTAIIRAEGARDSQPAAPHRSGSALGCGCRRRP